MANNIITPQSSESPENEIDHVRLRGDFQLL